MTAALDVEGFVGDEALGGVPEGGVAAVVLALVDGADAAGGVDADYFVAFDYDGVAALFDPDLLGALGDGEGEGHDVAGLDGADVGVAAVPAGVAGLA